MHGQCDQVAKVMDKTIHWALPAGFQVLSLSFFSVCYGRKDMLDLISQSDSCGVSIIMFRHEE